MGSAVEISAILFSICVVFAQGTLGHRVVCGELAINKCSFAVASSGKRCELFKNNTVGPVFKLNWRASGVVSEKLSGYTETDECVKACGLNPAIDGIRAEAFLSSKITTRFCLSDCYNKCPNTVDYITYLNKQEEGVTMRLLSLCEDGGD